MRNLKEVNMALSEAVAAAFNEQINKEFYSAYLYLSMANYFSNCGLDGMSNWMKMQYKEETFHAMKMIKYVYDRRSCVTLQAIAKPETIWSSALDVFESTLEHEEAVTASINNLIKICRENNDINSESFLMWFVNEQIEEEATADEICNKLKIISDGSSLYAIDRELAQRTYTEPAANE